MGKTRNKRNVLAKYILQELAAQGCMFYIPTCAFVNCSLFLNKKYAALFFIACFPFLFLVLFWVVLQFCTKEPF